MDSKSKNILVKQLQALNNKDFYDVFTLACPKHKDRPNDLVKNVMNYWRRHQGCKCKKCSSSSTKSCSEDQGTVSSRQPEKTRRHCRPAWEVAFVYRGDLILVGEKLFIDVEKVTELKTHKNLAGTVAVVNEARDLVFWAIIKQPEVCQYFRHLTGLSREKISIGIEPSKVRYMLKSILVGNILVGAAVSQDLVSLDINPAEINLTVIDTQDFFRDERGPFKLVDVAKFFLPEKSDFQCKQHSAIADARMTCKIAKRMSQLQRKGQSEFRDVHPGTKAKFFSVGDKCTCRTRKKKNKKKKGLQTPRHEDFFSDEDDYDPF